MKNEKIAVISGANRGIGKEILIALAKSKYTVIGTSRSNEGAEVINKIIKVGFFGISKVLILSIELEIEEGNFFL